MASIPTDQQLAISEWINDQFETAEPQELSRPPRDVHELPHWTSDPASGLTGDVYLGSQTVYYYGPDTPLRSGWWNMGSPPAFLR
jgi:hypothetical protein